MILYYYVRGDVLIDTSTDAARLQARIPEGAEISAVCVPEHIAEAGLMTQADYLALDA